MAVPSARETVSPRSAASRPLVRAIRPEIQALRALAVVAVIAYHYWPGVLRGGFVGVDVFFVISGFLITGVLMRGEAPHGFAAAVAFWASRARRLLPASLLVLATTAVAVFLVVPRSLWSQFFSEIVASTLYVQNWLLSANAVNYLAADNIPSPVQHFWSLSVEEQFYLVWPLLVLGTLWAVAKRNSRRATLWLSVVLGAVTVASLSYSVVITATQPSLAYYATTSRAWEFGAGGVLAVIVPRVPLRFDRLRAVASWFGLALIVGAALVYTGATPFPGLAALVPVVGALLVLWAGLPSARLAPSGLYSRPPVQFVGDISYSLYLWHFPLVVLAGYVLASSNGLAVKLSVLGLAILLAALSKRFVEDPVRRVSFWAAARPRRTFALVAAGMAIVVVLAGSGDLVIQRELVVSQQDAARLSAIEPACFGAAAGPTAKPGCPARTPVSKIVPQPAVADSDLPAIYTDACRSDMDDPAVRSCVFGKASAPIHVALIGDSHAASWFPALEEIAVQQGWQLTAYFKGSCPFSVARRTGGSTQAIESCTVWNTSLARTFSTGTHYNLVVTSDYGNESKFLGSKGELAAGVAGYRAAWAPLIANGANVIVISDTPHAGAHGRKCLLSHDGDPAVCSLDRRTSFDKRDDLPAAVHGHKGTALVDLNASFCTATKCPTVIGGVYVYRDKTHFTATFSRSLAPALLEAMARTGFLASLKG
jgi:peptidoglycan/LPS O-acetylase OafA/YrhL